MGGRGAFSGGTTKVYGHGLSKTGKPNSRSILYQNGKKKQVRYYGPDGRAVYDIDYFHQEGAHKFPHKHRWDWSKNPEHPDRLLEDE